MRSGRSSTSPSWPGRVGLGLALLAAASSAAYGEPSGSAEEYVTQLADEDPGARETAAERLLAMGPAAIPALLDAAAGENLAFAVPARDLLPQFGPEAIDAIMLSANKDLYRARHRDEAIAALVRMGEDALPRVMEVFTAANPYWSNWSVAAGALARQGRRTAPLLIPFLDDPKEKIRHHAAAVLGQQGDPQAFDALMTALDSEDPAVRMYSARGLGNIGDARAAERLLKALQDSDFGTRRAAAAALGKMYEPRFLEPLAQLARSDPVPRVRSTASNVLIQYSQDPVGVRLGERYRPQSLSPRDREAVERASGILFLLTGLTLVLIGWPGTAFWLRASGWRRAVALAVAALLVSVVGLAWGGLLQSVTGTVENVLLFVWIPLLSGSAYLFGGRSGPRLKEFRLAWLTMTLAFYGGYGVGWLWLWGHL